MACKESPDSDFKERGFTPEEFAKTYWVILEPTSTLKVWQMEGKLNKIRNKILFIRDVEQSQFIALLQMKQLTKRIAGNPDIKYSEKNYFVEHEIGETMR